jgi:hypothetical protein
MILIVMCFSLYKGLDEDYKLKRESQKNLKIMIVSELVKKQNSNQQNKKSIIMAEIKNILVALDLSDIDNTLIEYASYITLKLKKCISS